MKPWDKILICWNNRRWASIELNLIIWCNRFEEKETRFTGIGENCFVLNRTIIIVFEGMNCWNEEEDNRILHHSIDVKIWWTELLLRYLIDTRERKRNSLFSPPPPSLSLSSFWCCSTMIHWCYRVVLLYFYVIRRSWILMWQMKLRKKKTFACSSDVLTSISRIESDHE